MMSAGAKGVGVKRSTVWATAALLALGLAVGYRSCVQEEFDRPERGSPREGLERNGEASPAQLPQSSGEGSRRSVEGEAQNSGESTSFVQDDEVDDGSYGAVEVQLTDQFDRPLSGIPVEVRHQPEEDAKFRVVARGEIGENGRFLHPRVPVGTVDVRARSDRRIEFDDLTSLSPTPHGQKKWERVTYSENFEVHSGRTATVAGRIYVPIEVSGRLRLPFRLPTGTEAAAVARISGLSNQSKVEWDLTLAEDGLFRFEGEWDPLGYRLEVDVNCEHSSAVHYVRYEHEFDDGLTPKVELGVIQPSPGSVARGYFRFVDQRGREVPLEVIAGAAEPWTDLKFDGPSPDDRQRTSPGMFTVTVAVDRQFVIHGVPSLVGRASFSSIEAKGSLKTTFSARGRSSGPDWRLLDARSAFDLSRNSGEIRIAVDYGKEVELSLPLASDAKSDRPLMRAILQAVVDGKSVEKPSHVFLKARALAEEGEEPRASCVVWLPFGKTHLWLHSGRDSTDPFYSEADFVHSENGPSKLELERGAAASIRLVPDDSLEGARRLPFVVLRCPDTGARYLGHWNDSHSSYEVSGLRPNTEYEVSGLSHIVRTGAPGECRELPLDPGGSVDTKIRTRGAPR